MAKGKTKRRWPSGGPSKAEQQELLATLSALRKSVARSNQELADEALKKSGQDHSVDHLADHGTDNFEQDFTLSLLEGESEILQEIDDAIQKMNGAGEHPYGLCETCAESDTWEAGTGAPWIPTGRLEVVPYARLCVAHQEAEEED